MRFWSYRTALILRVKYYALYAVRTCSISWQYGCRVSSCANSSSLLLFQVSVHMFVLNVYMCCFV